MSKLEPGWYVTAYRTTPAHWYMVGDKWRSRLGDAICGMCSDFGSDLQPAGDVRHCKLCERALAKRGLVNG